MPSNHAVTDHPDYPLTLRCHPATPAPVVRSLEARAIFQPDGALRFGFRLWGDMARLRVPQTSSSQRADPLWEHTCFEAFVGERDKASYREFNFSPSGQWAAYAFSDYRQPDAALPLPDAPQIVTRLFAGRLEVYAEIAPASLPRTTGTLLIGLSAVVEAADAVDGSHSYWALLHPAVRPDFHHRAAFTLELTTPHTLI